MSFLYDGWLIQTLVVILIILFSGVYLYSIYCFNYWKNRGIRYVNGKFPFGTFRDVVLLNTSVSEFYEDLYTKNKGAKYVGYYVFFQPHLFVLDLDLVKNILVKDFSIFTNKGTYVNEKADPLSATLFAIGGTKWKKLRTKLVPLFTTSQMKNFFFTFKENAKKLQEYGLKIIKEGGVFDSKDVTGRYGLDVITSVVLGLEGNNFVNDKSDIKKIADMFMAPSLTQMIRISCSILCRSLAKFLRMRFTPKAVQDYFLNTIKETMEYRKKNKFERNDFMQLLINLKIDESVNTYGNLKIKGNEMKFTLEEMAAQAFIFVMAGFETTSAVATFCLYELALHQNIQKRLAEEFDAVGGEITHDVLHQLPYLEMVLNETLRKYPTIPVLQRECSEDYRLPGGEVIEKGTVVSIPLIGIQRDPQLFPDPEAFDPERFNEENIENILPYTFMPFGEGPRICIAARFARMQVKLAIYSIISRFNIDKCDKTAIPFVPERKSLPLNAEGGLFLKMTKRKK